MVAIVINPSRLLSGMSLILVLFAGIFCVRILFKMQMILLTLASFLNLDLSNGLAYSIKSLWSAPNGRVPVVLLLVYVICSLISILLGYLSGTGKLNSGRTYSPSY